MSYFFNTERDRLRREIEKIIKENIERERALKEISEDLEVGEVTVTVNKYEDYHETYYDGDIVILKRGKFEIPLIQRGSDDDYNEVYNNGDIIVLKRKTFGTESRQSNK